MNNRLRAIIVDDEKNARLTLQRILKMYCPEVNIIAEAADIVTAAKLLRQLKPDILFLDIRIGQYTGFDLLEMLPQKDFHLIFVTAYDEYALQAFEFSALDYLLKPIDPDRLTEVVERCKLGKNRKQLGDRLKNVEEQWQQQDPEVMVVNNDQGYHFITIRDLIRLSSDKGVTTFYLHQQPDVVVARNLAGFARILPEHLFFRCHQSHLINMSWISSYLFQDGGKIIMRDQATIPLARARKDNFLAKLKDFR
ncbi:MAG: LytTR family DNA-binding domain-containing protein [Bacteroidota bacterium]